MTVITLDRIWVHLAADPSQFVSLYSGGPSDKRSKAGEVRPYAGGRLRTITRTLRRQQIDIMLRLVTDADLALLDEWMGEVVMYRDPRGRLIFGSYFALDVEEYQDGSGYDVSFTLTGVTHSIAI